MCLLAICTSSEKCLFTSFAHLLIEFIFPLWSCKRSLFWIGVPYQTWFAYIFFLFYTLSFTFLMVSLAAQMLSFVFNPRPRTCLLTLERGKRGRERRGEEHWCRRGTAIAASPKDQTHKPAMCLDEESNPGPFVLMGRHSNQLSHTCQGCSINVLNFDVQFVIFIWFLV